MSRIHMALAFGVALGVLALVATADRGTDANPAQFSVEPFSQVAYGLPGALTLVNGSRPLISIQGSAKQLEAIEVVVDAQILHIRARERGWRRNVDLDSVQVQVDYDSLSGLSVNGSGRVHAEAISAAQCWQRRL